MNAEKTILHARNRHRGQYDFESLINVCPQLSAFVFINPYQNKSIDFSNPEAVKVLNQALLKYFYNIGYWDIPAGYLCPPVPGRADYIHYMADLLATTNNGIIPKGPLVKVLDIGVGANCIYPLIGNYEYGWRFVGTDIDPDAIGAVRKIIAVNGNLEDVVEVRLQENISSIFEGIVNPHEQFDMCICNPPFHSSLAEALAGSQRKAKNLGYKPSKKTVLNFGGRHTELWCSGGETAFVRHIIKESANLPKLCFWFSSLISKNENLPAIYDALKQAKVFDFKTILMAQGQKISRIVAWTFLDEDAQKTWQNKWRSCAHLRG